MTKEIEKFGNGRNVQIDDGTTWIIDDLSTKSKLLIWSICSGFSASDIDYGLQKANLLKEVNMERKFTPPEQLQIEDMISEGGPIVKRPVERELPITPISKEMENDRVRVNHLKQQRESD